MAPAPKRLSVSNFAQQFGSLRTQAYVDPSQRNSSFHSLRTIAWNPLGTLIATGSSDKTLRVWNPEKPSVRNSTSLSGHAAAIEKVAFNPKKEAELCSVSIDGVVKFWDVRTKTVVNEVKGLGEAFTLVWCPDGESVIVGNKADNLFILSPTESTPISSHQQSGQTNQIAFCWSGKRIFITTGEGKTRILSYPALEPILQYPQPPSEFALAGHTSACHSVEMQPTGRHLATGGADSIIALWDTTDWICQRTLIDMTGPVQSISFTADGSYIVGGSNEGNNLEISHTESGEHVYTVKTAGPCPIVAFHPLRYALAYTDLGSLKIIGVEPERR